MFDSLVKKFAKNYICKTINSLLTSKNTDKIIQLTSSWTSKLTKILLILNNTAKRCEDKDFSTEDADRTAEEIQELIKEF